MYKRQCMKIYREVENEEPPMEVTIYRFILNKELKYLSVTMVSSNREDSRKLNTKQAESCSEA